MYIMKNLLLFLLFFSLIACNETQKKDDYTKVNQDSEQIELAQTAKTNMENKCYLCHSPSASKENRVGPPMAAIKARYMKDASTKEEFVSAIWNFVEKPTEDKAKLKGAVRRFGVMPYQKFNQKEIEAIAAYMYDYEIEEPEWFKSHWEKEHGGKHKRKGKKLAEMTIDQQDYAKIGMKYAKSTKAQLGKNLMGAIQKEGVIHALEFCNVQAMPITDSMATVHQAKIKRVSDKNRNPNNKANTEELAHIASFKNVLKKGEEPKPILEETEDKVNFYYPIITNDMCLKCHGKPEQQIAKETYDKILKLYPEDLAIGYDVNEVRGIWSIEFKKESAN